METIEEVRAEPSKGIGHQASGAHTPPFTLLEIVDKDHAKVRIASDLGREGDLPGKEQTKEVLLAIGNSLSVHTYSYDAGATYTLRISDLKTVPPVMADSPDVVATLNKYAEIIKDGRGSIQFIGPPGAVRRGEKIDKSKLERWKNPDATFWQNLSRLNNLRSLDLTGTDLTDSDLKTLRSLPRLMKLDLSGTNLTDAGMVHLEGLKRLEELNLSETPITDNGIKHLAGVQHLENLGLMGTGVGDDCVGSLHKTLPGCKIYGPTKTEENSRD